MIDPLLPQAAADTLGLVQQAGSVVIKAPVAALWCLVWPFLLGLYVMVQCVVASATALYDRLKVRI